MRELVLKFANYTSILWLLLPSRIRNFFITSLLILESRDRNTKKGLIRIFRIKDKLEWIINERSLKYENGIHPKHRLTDYHSFFIERIKNGEKILDVGCGNGMVAMSIAKAFPKSFVLGVDINNKNIEFAENISKEKGIKNIRFVKGDISNEVNINADVVILSNVLEHIKKRVIFLQNILKKSKAKKFLIRVPLFERDWQIALRKELDTYYFSDNDHKIEHTVKEFKKEINQAGFYIKDMKTIWGEIWAECEYE